MMLRLMMTTTPLRATSSPAAAALAVALALSLAGGTVSAARPGDDLHFAPADPEPSRELPPSRPRRTVPARAPAPRPAAMPVPAYAPIARQDEAAEAVELDMVVGESRVLPAPGVGRIAVGNGQIMTASALDEREVILFANGVGSTTLFVWNQDGRHQRVKVNITAGDISRVAREVAAFLSAIPNASTSVVGDKVIVEGDGLSDADRDKVAELAKRYPQIVNFTSPVGWEQMVMMDVKVVEFPRTELSELGMKWSATGGAAVGAIWSLGGRGDSSKNLLNIAGNLPISGTSGPVVATSALTTMSALNLGLNGELNLLQQDGRASILAEPQLSTRSGYKASFLAGGEFPYSVATINGVTVQFKPYGIKLDIEPKVGRDGVIRAVIESEVSSIDSSVSTTGGPALLTRKTKTEFNVHAGETIVLSGLLQRNTSTDIDKVPLLGDLPVLGALFRSKRFQNKETELVVFVTPTLVDSHTPELAERVRRATGRLNQTLGPQPHLSAPLQPGRDAGAVTPAAAPAASSLVW
jgi:pilus assembly protein CpaC